MHAYLSKLSTGVAAAFLTFAVIFGPAHILYPYIGIPFPANAAAGIGIAIFAAGFFLEREKPRLHVFAAFSAALLALYLFSDFPWRPRGFVQSARISLFISGCIAGGALWAVLRRAYLPLIAAVCVAVPFAAFFGTQGNAMLFSDDHPCFLYRLTQLKAHFPAIPYFNPLWNSGVEAREFFASGVLNFFLLFSPLVYTLDLPSSYTMLVLAFLFIVVPLLALASARLAGLERSGQAIAAVLTLAGSLLWYRWALKYGTLGFIVSASLVPFNVFLTARMFAQPAGFTARWIALLAASITLMLLWSPSALLMAPLGLYGLFELARLPRKRAVLATAALVVALNLPWMALFFRISSVGDFVANSAFTDAGDEETEEDVVHRAEKFKGAPQTVAGVPPARALLNLIREHALFTNPLVLALGLPGLFFLQGVRRRMFLVTAGSALVLSLAGPLVRPQLELERLFMVLTLLLAIPAAAQLEKLLELWQGKRAPQVLLRSAFLGALSLSPLWLWNVMSNSTVEHYATAAPIVRNLSEAMKSHHGGGRVMFAGFTLHELSKGHVAPLAAFTGLPLIASSYQHDRWQYTDVIPEHFRVHKDAGVMRYLDLQNVSAVVTHDKFWRRWFGARRDRFEQVWKEGRFTIFRRKEFVSSYFEDGKGELLAQGEGFVKLRIDTPDAILRFNYLPFLKATGCQIEPFPVDGGLTLVRLHACRPGETVTISAKGAISRLFS